MLSEVLAIRIAAAVVLVLAAEQDHGQYHHDELPLRPRQPPTAVRRTRGSKDDTSNSSFLMHPSVRPIWILHVVVDSNLEVFNAIAYYGVATSSSSTIRGIVVI